MLAIEGKGLRKVFPKGVVAVDGIDLEIREGEIFGFLGPNGAGKSTTIRMLTTLLRPTDGDARVAGLDVVQQATEVRRTIGVALQEAGLDALATGRELLVLQARLYGFGGQEPARRAQAMLDLVGLADAADRRVKTYSGGMKRRLDLASALIHGPKILFLDEPTSGLDPASRQAIWDEIRRLNREGGITVFLTTQYMEEADRLAGRLAIIDRGRIVADGTPAALKASIASDVVTIEVPDDQREAARSALEACEGVVEMQPDSSGLTLFVDDGTAVVARVIRHLDRASVRVGAVAVAHPSLDEVFLRATGYRLEGAAEPDGQKEEVPSPQ
jgi:ABC-2 type transport system ATP-binding protein